MVSEIVEQIERFMEALNCGALLIGRDGRIEYANAVLSRMLGRCAAELAGLDLRALYTEPAARERLQEMLDRFDAPHEGEFYLPLADGARLPVVTSARRLDGAGKDFRLVTIVDISAQKEAEQDLKTQYDIIANLSNTMLEQAVSLKHHSEELEGRVRERTRELHEANLDAIYMLAVASEAKDEDTGAHVRRIEELTRVLAKEMGTSAGEAVAIGYSAILHDVGKIHVADQILKKPGALTDEERAVMQEHTVVGERILSTKPFFERARRIARSHHENWDGSGYPDGLAGTAIPREARIVHLADVYDALTSARVYKKAWSGYEAAEVIRESSGKMFDPEVVKAFERLMARGALQKEWPTGGRLGALSGAAAT